MTRIRIRHENELEWIRPHADISESEREKFTEEELSAEVRFREAGSLDSPQLIEIRYPPNAEIRLHAHTEDEIIFVREGELHFGNHVLKKGASLFVAGGTLYSFKAGSESLQILNFRPRQDTTFITKDEYLAKRSTTD